MNLNPIDFDYVDGLNTYPLQDYIDENISSNISNNNIYITSNTYSSNVSLNNNQKLDNSLYYLNACNLNNQTNNLILSNNFNFGEISFKTSYNYPSSNRAGTIIDYTGKLQVYHNYNLLQPTFLEGYYDVEGELLALKADGITNDIQLTALEAGALAIQDEIISLTQAGNLTEGKLNSLINNIDVAKNITDLRELNNALNYGDASFQYISIINNLRNSSAKIYFDSFVIGLAVSTGIGLAGAAIGSVSTQIYYQQASNSLYNNNNLSSNDKYTIYSNNTSNEIILYSNYNVSTSNLAINQGFLNSNTITSQYINSLNVSNISLNNINISNIFVDSNIASNTSNTLFNYSSNINLNTSNTLFNEYSNINLNSSNNTYIYTSNNIDRFNITLPDTNFWYDYTNSLWCYDLNIEKYISSSNLGSGFKARSFRIQTLVPKADWRTFNNLYMNNQFINNPETLVFHMNNSSNYFGNITPNDNYANAIILGKSRDTNIGYWNTIPNNYSYIRYLARVGWSVDIILEKLL